MAWIALTAAMLGACSRGSDEDQIRALLNAMESAAEEHNLSKVMDLIADDYSDDLGRNKAELKNIARVYFLTHPKIELIAGVKDVTIEGPNNARVHLELSMIGTRQGNDVTSLTAQSEPLRIDFKRIDSKWRVVRADRRRD